MQAWVARDESGIIYALSPVCKHLGCLVSWGSKEHPDQFHCPCHGARYAKNGKQIVVAPKPLDEYEVKVKNGWVYLGSLIANQHAK
jgi:menaquinol-cytochrome c reductase iron-sulfur subunit